MKAGVAIDTWKERIFRRELEEDGWDFTVVKGVSKKTRLIQVKHEDGQLPALRATIERCQQLAAQSRTGRN